MRGVPHVGALGSHGVVGIAAGAAYFEKNRHPSGQKFRAALAADLGQDHPVMPFIFCRWPSALADSAATAPPWLMTPASG